MLFGLLFYYLSAFLLILFLHNNGCVELFKKQALLRRMGPSLARELRGMQEER